MNTQNGHLGTQITRYEALAAADATGTIAAPAALLIEQPTGQLPRVLAIGDPRDVKNHPAWGAARRVECGGCVLLPGMVNAHTHLDLTHLGPRAFDAAGGFTGWAEMVRMGRRVEEAEIAASVRKGVELSLAGGVVAVGDIAGAAGGRPCFEPLRVLRESPLLGVSYLEFFGIGNRLETAMSRLGETVERLAAMNGEGIGRVLGGLQPHAPYSVDLRLYLAAVELAQEHDLRMSTHLAETLDEGEFVECGTGSLRRFLEGLGLWCEGALEGIGKGLHPVEHLMPVLGQSRFVVAHVNDGDDAAIEGLARTATSVAYCPRASEYFGAERVMGPHRYREMLDAGVNVCLGTDSIVNLPASAADVSQGGISVLDEARLLFRRDGMDAKVLLGMLTTRGANALGLDSELFRFRSGKEIAGVAAVDVGDLGERGAVEAVLGSDAPCRLVAGPQRWVGQAAVTRA